MKSFRLLPPAVCLLFALAVFAAPPKDAPPPPAPPDAEAVKAIKEQVKKLDSQIRIIRSSGVSDPYLADVEIYLKAAEWVLKHDEFTQKGAGPDAVREVLDRGLLRQPAIARRGAVAVRDRPGRRPRLPLAD